jgi:hypothetical protein
VLEADPPGASEYNRRIREDTVECEVATWKRNAEVYDFFDRQGPTQSGG